MPATEAVAYARSSDPETDGGSLVGAHWPSGLTQREVQVLRLVAAGKSLPQALEEATTALSGLSRCAGLVVAPKTERRSLKHIEFVPLSPGRALVVMVTEDGLVENRLIEVPLGTPPSTMVAASNYLSSRLVGHTIDEAKAAVALDIDSNRAQLDELTKRLVEAGLAEATKIITEKRQDLETLAKGLLEYETLTGKEIVNLMKGHLPVRDTGDDRESMRGFPVPTTGVVRPKPGPEPGGLEPQPQA